MTLPPPIRYSPTQHKYLLEQAADLHMACVLEDGTLATFLPHRNPESNALEFDRQKVQDYWAAYGTDVDNGSREIILQFSDENETEVIGVVSLGWAYSETGPFRGNIHKLFTSPQHRFKGVGKRLMMKVEEVARERGKTLLVRRASSTSSKPRTSLLIARYRCLTRRLALEQSTFTPRSGIRKWALSQGLESTPGPVN